MKNGSHFESSNGGRRRRHVDIGSYSGFDFLLIHKTSVAGLWCTRNYTKLWVHKGALDMIPAF